jgi:hypothetical protein
MWIAGFTICLLATAGLVAIVRSIPVSYASISDKGAPPARRAVPSSSDDASIKAEATQLLPESSMNIRRNRASCPDCGIVESMREVERSGGASGNATAMNAVTGKRYEFTVRFRDGSTTVIEQANPQAWQLGTQVIVVGRSTASKS